MRSKAQTPSLSTAPNTIFVTKKSKILQALAADAQEYTDASPKGSLDAPIIDLINEINAHIDLVTTSSCSGRVSVFVDGPGEQVVNGELEPSAQDVTAGQPEAESTVRAGGKGGGRWLFTSHEPDASATWAGQAAEQVAAAFGMRLFNGVEITDDCDESREEALSAATEVETTRSQRPQLVHFKFEPMILHVLTSSLTVAQRLLQAAQQAGFRESGISGVLSATPMVAIRTNGLALESIIGMETNDKLVCLIDVLHLRMLFALAKERFAANRLRIGRLQEQIRVAVSEQSDAAKNVEWEDTETRRQRKRAEGLAHKARMKEQKMTGRDDAGYDADMLDAGFDIP